MTQLPCSRRTFLHSAAMLSGGLWGAAATRWPPDACAQVPAKPSSLTITNVQTFALHHKLPRATGVSTGLADARRVLLVKISTDSGLVGWGETSDVGGTRAHIEERLKPLLMGKNPLEHRPLWRALWGANFGDGRAVAGVDIALHDVRGKALGLSIAELYGSRLRDKALAYASGMNYTAGIEPERQFPAEAAELVQRGFTALKVRTGRLTPRRDLALLAKIRETVGSDIRLLTDGNGAFTFSEAVKFAKELEKLDFYCFEEPLPQGLNYAGYETLTASLDIAIAGGEVLDSRVSARDLIVRRSFDIIQPDVTLCGGIAETIFIAELARLWSVQCVPHCWSGALNIAATLQILAVLPNATFGLNSEEPMLEFDVIENPFRDEIITQPFAVDVTGHVAVPKGPGLGVDVDEAVVKKYQVPA